MPRRLHWSFSFIILSALVLALALFCSPISCRELRFTTLTPTFSFPAFLPRHLHLPPFLSRSATVSPKMPSKSSSSTNPYARELLVASLAVQRAAVLTQKVFHLRTKGTILKPDQSPVTVGDYGAQALIIAALKHAFPEDEIIAEEEASDLRADPELSGTVWQIVNSTRFPGEEEDESEGEGKDGHKHQNAKKAQDLLGGHIPTEVEMINHIDSGKSQGGRTGRIWAIDPIDGTKGFVRGDQYAVCLGLIVDGQVQVGVLGCPNMPIDESVPLDVDAIKALPEAEKGVLFSASKGFGAFVQPLDVLITESDEPGHPSTGPSTSPSSSTTTPQRKKISVSKATSPASVSFVESYESAHSAHSDHVTISQKLGLKTPPVRMDSQAKYGALARGADVVYLRLPAPPSSKTGKRYPQTVWDHAAGNVIVTEAGGRVADVAGKELDFGAGRTMDGVNVGVVATPGGVFEAVIGAVKEVMAEKETVQ